MIYTVTWNPSLDYMVSMDNFTLGSVNRTEREQLYCGGKGINVSLVLKNLGIDSVALGFVAGFTGREIVSRLEDAGVRADFITVANGYSRINVKLRSREESEINGRGPLLSEKEQAQLYQRLERLQDGDTLVLAGSVPYGLSDHVYEDVLKSVQHKDLRIVVDATGDLLVRTLPYHPFLIKPNHHELAEIYGVTISSAEEVVTYAKKLQDGGARNVLVSMAGDGAVLLTEDGRSYTAKPPSGKVVNSVGAGDSMVAGFLAGYEQQGDYETAFRMGICTGSASAFSEGLATREEVQRLLEQMKE